MSGGLSAAASRATVAHGNANSRLHDRHQEEQNERRGKARLRVVYRDVKPEQEPEKFKSKLLDLAPEGMKGRSFWCGSEELTEMDGDAWEEKLISEGKRLEVWHERRCKCGKVSYHRHKLKESDLKRRTFELRPDHSRALEIMGARRPDSLMAEVLGAIREEKVRLFEEVYGRRVMAVGEHCDSGHYHNDLWHFSSREKQVGDKTIIERGTFFREYGVGPGAARWDRHLRVLSELGLDVSVMGPVRRILAADEKRAQEQNGEAARDLRYMRSLDAFVEKILLEIDRGAVKKAKDEYGRWLVGGYGKGELGVSKAKERKEKRLEELEKEVGQLKGVLALVGQFLSALVRLPGMDKILSHEVVAPLFQRVMAACGLVEPEVRDVKRPREQAKEMKELKMVMGRRRKISPDSPRL